MRVLVIGKTGQVAQSLKERSAEYPELLLSYVGRPEIDLEAPRTLRPVIEEWRPDVIVNAAAWTDVDGAEDEPERAIAVNAVAAGRLAMLAREIGARIIHLSTDYVFDGTKAEPYEETDLKLPHSVYGGSKLQGEANVRHETPDHLILRTAWVYSPYGKNFVKTMLGAAQKHESLRVVEDQHGNPTSALDIADIILEILQRWIKGDNAGLGETYHCTAQGQASWAEFARYIFAVSKKAGGPSALVQGIPSEEWPTKARRPKNSRLDCLKLAGETGLYLPHWKDSVSIMIGKLLDQESIAV